MTHPAPRGHLYRMHWAAVLLVLLTATAQAQAADDARPSRAEQGPFAPAAVTDTPITGRERVNWIVVGTIGPRSLGVGVLAAGWDTLLNTPEEWGSGAKGYGKRYLQREADVAISNSLEAGLGAIWGEDPRFVPSKRQGLWPRVGWAMKTVVLAPRRDGRLAPAWGRYAGNVFNNVIENAWLPPSVTTPGQTALRSANGLLGRLVGNLWDEFWPDVWKRISR